LRISSIWIVEIYLCENKFLLVLSVRCIRWTFRFVGWGHVLTLFDIIVECSFFDNFFIWSRIPKFFRILGSDLILPYFSFGTFLINMKLGWARRITIGSKITHFFVKNFVGWIRLFFFLHLLAWAIFPLLSFCCDWCIRWGLFFIFDFFRNLTFFNFFRHGKFSIL
jgi:hypothetical protein